ncbi:MAG: DUF4126 domain-containing protein [Acidobacteria bacterium]|uniref:DUF4126 domain-containing protein n=1 Tax=Candidatus Polarisedimenticola svalbardensis TaxID=2886004 RepID=A0A8J7CLJ9_9BACT|nr:DUF4126 domain-containing protein [Candidatus Polarisedimenticola svalbardensis]
MDLVPQLLFQILMGIGLAASAGLRAFLPLLVVGVAGRVGWVPLSDSFSWLSDWPALCVLAVAVLVEVLSDKFPAVDNFLDMIQVFVKPVAGTILVASVVTDLSPLQTTVLALILGSGTAGTVHVVKAKTRLVSTVSTAGVANPILSVAEDTASLAGSVLSLIVPPVVVLVLVFTLVFVYVQVRKGRLGLPGSRKDG